MGEKRGAIEGERETGRGREGKDSTRIKGREGVEGDGRKEYSKERKWREEQYGLLDLNTQSS